MGIRVQRASGASSVRAGNAVYTYPDESRAAILFVRVEDAEAMKGLAQVYKLHGASMANLGERAPRRDRASGRCLIHNSGITVTFGAVEPSAENGGHGMLGAKATVPWGATDPDWMNAALEEGCVWAGLVSEEVYQSVCAIHPVVNDGVLETGVHLSEVPTMSVLKLAAQRG